MKLYNGDIFSAREPIQVLIGLKFPVLISYKLAKLANKLNEQLKIIEDVRLGLVKKYGAIDERGQTVVPDGSEEYKKFYEEFMELLDQEVELVIEKVKLPNDDSIAVEPRILMALEKFVEV